MHFSFHRVLLFSGLGYLNACKSGVYVYIYKYMYKCVYVIYDIQYLHNVCKYCTTNRAHGIIAVIIDVCIQTYT